MGNRLSRGPDTERRDAYSSDSNNDDDEEDERHSDQHARARSKKKRKIDDLGDNGSEEDELERLLSTPKKKKLLTSTEYIYNHLFKEGKESDVVVTALDRSWNLHKLYLCQSPYFSSLFSGRWEEGRSNSVKLTIVDPNITHHSLDMTFASFYNDLVEVKPIEVLSVLATASLFQLQGLINQCLVIMEETLNIHTVLEYHEASNRYGHTEMEKKTFQWLEINLLNTLPDHPFRLREVTIPLMTKLVASPDLFVMQTEFSVYILLRLWVFLQVHPNWDGIGRQAVSASQKFFRSRKPKSPNRTESAESSPEPSNGLEPSSSSDASALSLSSQTIDLPAASRNEEKKFAPYFLDSDEGLEYCSVFRELKLRHLTNHHMDVDILEADKVIPPSWLSNVYRERWMSLLRLDSGVDTGPSHLADDDFEKNCFRCGRTLNKDGEHMWRWTGFNSGLDLIVTYNKYKISLKRSVVPGHEALVCNHSVRSIVYRVTVVSVNEQLQTIYHETSGVKQVLLGVNEKISILELDQVQTVFPLLLSFNFCVVSPAADQPSNAVQQPVAEGGDQGNEHPPAQAE